MILVYLHIVVHFFSWFFFLFFCFFFVLFFLILVRTFLSQLNDVQGTVLLIISHVNICFGLWVYFEEFKVGICVV